MKRNLAAAATTALASAALVVSPAVATGSHLATPAAGSPLRFTTIQYDPPGSDLPATPAKLNAEYVTIYNPTSTSRPVSAFRIHDVGFDHTYHFGTFRLGAHKSVRLHTGPGHNTATNRYWGLDNYVWNNTGDTATLQSNIGTVVDTCKWTDGSGIIHC